MDLDLFNSELCLAADAPIRLLSARGVRIRCTSGVVWLTIAGEAGDIFLAAGDSYLVRSRGLALLEAIGGGRVRFEKGQPTRVGLFHHPAEGMLAQDLLFPGNGWRGARHPIGVSIMRLRPGGERLEGQATVVSASTQACMISPPVELLH
jgi:hypothetical protein